MPECLRTRPLTQQTARCPAMCACMDVCSSIDVQTLSWQTCWHLHRNCTRCVLFSNRHPSCTTTKSVSTLSPFVLFCYHLRQSLQCCMLWPLRPPLPLHSHATIQLSQTSSLPCAAVFASSCISSTLGSAQFDQVVLQVAAATGMPLSTRFPAR